MDELWINYSYLLINLKIKSIKLLVSFFSQGFKETLQETCVFGGFNTSWGADLSLGRSIQRCTTKFNEHGLATVEIGVDVRPKWKVYKFHNRLKSPVHDTLFVQ